MAVDLRTAEVTGLYLTILDSEGRIDGAIDSGDRRAFRGWCRRRASHAARLQRILIILVTSGTGCT